MITFKYSDLTDSSTMAYKTFDKHYKSIETRREQLETKNFEHIETIKKALTDAGYILSES